jgi:hypothetical protein
MQRRHRHSRHVIVAALVSLLAIACSKTETEQVVVNPARVIVSGPFAVLSGQSVQLTASTVNGSDAGYAWASSDAGVAKVSATGLVTGVVPGNATITATGTETGLSGSYNVVVANEIAQQAAWLGSGHADAASEAFNHWNAEGSVSSSCARCHSTPGFRDYLGDDGSTPFKVDANAPLGTVVSCDACHNATAQTLSQVTFPYASSRPADKKTLTGLGAEARCMTCHQGRESRSTVDAAVDAAGLGSTTDADVVTTAVSFKNVHYLPAGATLNGARAGVGYEYAGKKYDWRFRHVPEKDSCIECHDPHSLKVDVASCATCHAGVSDAAALHDIRFKSSLAVDYDGDGNTTEGIAGEIDGLRETLLAAIQRYATAKGSAICYSATTYPYFILDSNADGDCTGESGKFDKWTARLVRATFNYQLSVKEPGAFAHNAKYMIQLLFDAIEDVNAGIPAEDRIDMTAMRRDDIGHFHGSGEAVRHWDTTGLTGSNAACSKCHSGSEGFRFFLSYGVTKPVTEPGNGLDCATCHTGFPASEAAPNLVSVASVTFPSGKVVSPNPTAALESRLTGPSFICMTCHQGREAKSTVDAAMPAGDPDAINTTIKFKNVHYLAAGAVLLGSEAAVGYEYTGRTYAGRHTHPLGIDCNACHSGSGTQHTFQVSDNLGACYGCHGIPQPSSVDELRGSIFAANTFDYDGDGNVTEPLHDELAGLSARLLTAMQDYATAKGGVICYSPTMYPYFLKAGGDGTCATAAAAYANWTPRLARAAFNYQLLQKEPGAWAHNMSYASQLLYDGIADLGGATTGLTRAP